MDFHFRTVPRGGEEGTMSQWAVGEGVGVRGGKGQESLRGREAGLVAGWRWQEESVAQSPGSLEPGAWGRMGP